MKSHNLAFCFGCDKLIKPFFNFKKSLFKCGFKYSSYPSNGSFLLIPDFLAAYNYFKKNYFSIIFIFIIIINN